MMSETKLLGTSPMSQADVVSKGDEDTSIEDDDIKADVEPDYLKHNSNKEEIYKDEQTDCCELILDIPDDCVVESKNGSSQLGQDLQMTEEKSEIQTKDGTIANDMNKISQGDMEHVVSNGAYHSDTHNIKFDKETNINKTDDEKSVEKIQPRDIRNEVGSSEKRDVVEKHISNTKLCKKNKLKQEIKTYSCSECTYKFVKIKKLIRHMRLHRKEGGHFNSEKVFQCDMCNYKSARKVNLLTHMRTHTEKLFLCNICDQKFAQNKGLLSHMRKHSGEKRFLCNICHQKYARKRDLLKHTAKHDNEKYSCKICYLTFVRKLHLKNHMITHKDDKPFSCNTCNFKSAQKWHLISHMRTHIEKSSSCNICDQKFARKSQFTHTGVKPCSCHKI